MVEALGGDPVPAGSVVGAGVVAGGAVGMVSVPVGGPLSTG